MNRWRTARAACMFAGAAIAATAAEPPLSESSRAAARYDYLLHCSGCHRADGAGAPPEVPSLRGPVGELAATPAGRAYIAQVPEVAQAPLDDAALARLLNWVLFEFNADTLPTDFRLLDGAEVATLRVDVLADPLRRRAEILGRYEAESDTR